MRLRDVQVRRTLEAYRARGVTAALAESVALEGIVAVEGEVTGDGRKIESGALEWEPPIPIIWDRNDGDHTGMIVGRYTSLSRKRDGSIWGSGELTATDDPDTAAAVRRIAELIGDGMLGQSVALDRESVRFEAKAVKDDGEEWRYDDEVQIVTGARVRHVALVDTAAFAQAVPVLAAVRAIPADHVADWGADRAPLTPFTVDDDGRIWGHAAGSGCHRGMANCWTYTADVDPDMRGFHLGTFTLDDGTTAKLGPLTFAGLHADATMSRTAARRHHEDGSTVVGLVRAWNDAKGRLAIAGTTVDGLSATVVEQMRACQPSFEQWPEGGGLTLIGLHLVPTPALPVAASVDGGGVVAVECGCDESEPCEEHDNA